MGAAVVGIDQGWTTKNNEVVELTDTEVKQLYQTLQIHVASIHERSRIARQLIEEANTISEIDSISI